MYCSLSTVFLTLKGPSLNFQVPTPFKEETEGFSEVDQAPPDMDQRQLCREIKEECDGTARTLGKYWLDNFGIHV